MTVRFILISSIFLSPMKQPSTDTHFLIVRHVSQYLQYHLRAGLHVPSLIFWNVLSVSFLSLKVVLVLLVKMNHIF